ncbi:glutamate 5-kinase [Waddlia chondrophila]|uniref:Glutamate 5-kinase n=1 Tax=Waddlia chondrophila (strain ATCC VR-1470 / WSU 86-1044) TaxID=716544 RepID=D6YRV6_WADCW|nr:glutamate 5-kinase [Waddlia chondrophila]ADI38801.1 gamma-glutamate kinase [Waddlia chondrophila WSU 86-1044]
MKKIVIKVGTSTLTDGGLSLSQKHMIEIVRQIAKAHNARNQIVLVSSGSIAAGKDVLKPSKLDRSLPEKQMLSSIGQVHLMNTWKQLFAIYQLQVGQLLLTKGDFSQRDGYLNVRNTIDSLLHHGVIPIVNENDTVATREIQFGDNDNIAALVANLIAADQLILLTDQKGLYTADPNRDPNAVLIEDVHVIDKRIIQLAGKTTKGKGMGAGGMSTKVEAAKLATRSGTPTIIASSKNPTVIAEIIEGKKTGTYFYAETTPKESRKRWLLSEKVQGVIFVDQGAEKKITEKGASLLPIGITGSEKSYGRGSIVEILSSSNRAIARGIVNYSSDEIQKLIGAHSTGIEKILGYSYGSEVIHRDNMALL